MITERLPEVVAPFARRTLRLEHWFTVVGFAAGGAAGARLLRELGLVATLALVLARLRTYRVPHSATPRVLGVDDFGATRSRRGSCTAFERRNRTWSSASSTLPG